MFGCAAQDHHCNVAVQGLKSRDILKNIIQWGLFIWSKKLNDGYPKLGICAPFDDEKTTEDKESGKLIQNYKYSHVVVTN